MKQRSGKLGQPDAELSPTSTKENTPSAPNLPTQMANPTAVEERLNGLEAAKNRASDAKARQWLLYELATLQASQSMRVGRLLLEGSRSVKGLFRVILMLVKERKARHKVSTDKDQMLLQKLKNHSKNKEVQIKSIKPTVKILNNTEWQSNEKEMWLDCEITGGGSVELHVKIDAAVPDRSRRAIVSGILQFNGAGHGKPNKQVPIKKVNDAGETIFMFVLPQECSNLRVIVAKFDISDWDLFSAEIYHFQRGITVVVPTCNAVKNLPSLLSNLSEFCSEQPNSECIVISNGPDDGSFQYLERYRDQLKPSWLRVFRIEQASVGGARNLGLSKSSFDHVTFVDDDDFLSSNFATDIADLLDGESIVIASLRDVVNTLEFGSLVTYQIEAYQGLRNISCSFIPAIYAMNACKVSPAYLLRLSAFDEDMARNEDVLFWSRIAAIYRPLNTITAQNSPSIYFRQLTADSLSRQYDNFDAQVIDRIETISRLSELLNDDRCREKSFVIDKIKEQLHMLRLFVERYPEQAELTEKTCLESGLELDLVLEKT